MIALPSIAFGGFSGSAKGVTARYTGGRSILSLKSRPSGAASSAQIARRTSLKTVSKTWQTLSDEQRQNWERLAEQSSGVSVFGQKAKLSGMNLYMRLNLNRQMAGETILGDAPQTATSVPIAAFSKAVVTPELIVLSGITHQAAPNKLVLKMSASQSSGVSSGWSKTVIISSGLEDDWGEADVTQLYLKTIGVEPTVGEKVFIEAYWMDTATGFTGQAQKATAVVTGDSSYKRRLHLTTEDLNPEKTQSVATLDVDYSTAAPAVWFDTLCTGQDGVSSSEAYLDEKLPDECLVTSMVLARGMSEDGSLHPQSYEVQATNVNGKARLTFMFRCGKYVKTSEAFGAGVTYK